MPAPPFQPQPVPASNSGGCSTALVIIGIIVGVIVLAVIIIAIVVNRAEGQSKDGARGVSSAVVTAPGPDGRADRNGLL